VWSTLDPGRLRVPFSAEAGPGSHKTGSISASHMSELKSNDTQRILMNFHVVCSGLRTDKAIPGLVFDVQDP